jgi:DNA-binding NarL/FixJ family response regulator
MEIGDRAVSEDTAAPEAVRVLLVDDHALVRAGLAALLDGSGTVRVVGQAADGREAVELVEACRPDVVLMDLSMPGMDGVAATRAVLGQHPGTAVVILTSFAEQPRVRGAIDAGAVGFLLKDSDPADLVAGVRSAARGEVPLDPRVTRALLPGAGTGNGERLSPREREVLTLVGEGMANKQIARALGITERTVKVHLTSVFRQLGVADRTSAALWAREHLGAW